MASDRECLEEWRRERSAERLRPLVERYLAFVYSAAHRRMGSADDAGEVTRAVFLVLARRARKLRKTVLAGWLFQVTTIACQKLLQTRVGRLRRLWNWVSRKARVGSLPDAALWMRVGPGIDRALERLSSKHRNAVLLRAFLNYDSASAARILRTREPRAEKRFARGMRKLAKRLSKRRAPVDPGALAAACVIEGCAIPLPEGLAGEILTAIEETRGKRPSLKLARRTLRSLAWKRWRRRIVIGVPTSAVALAIIGGIAWHISSLSGHSALLSTFVIWSVRYEAIRVPALREPARPWPTNAATLRMDASVVRNAQDLYGTTNIWLAHLSFTREQWKAIEPKHIGAMANFVRTDGLWELRNPKAQRSGLAGVLGYEFDWAQAAFEFGGVAFTNVAVRVKGNGSWLGSLMVPKRAFKVDLNKFARGQKLGGLDELTFNNLVWNYSSLSDALGYEFFRDTGVPAPRTAYAWISASVAKQWDRKPLGLYLMVETVDESFALERFGTKRTPIFKPVTYDLFTHLGDEWPAYEAIYDLKTEATPRQKRRVIDFTRLISSATDEEFAAQVGEFLDLDEFARFLAGQVLLSSYDSILVDGQNFYMYLDPSSDKFGFIPWDLDAAWGDFWIGTKKELERASIWHPWVGKNRFIERVMGVEEFRTIYRGHLEDFLTRLFVPERLNRRIDEMVAVIREPVAAESAFKLNKFEQAVGLKLVERSPEDTTFGINHPAHDLKGFIKARARSVREQLDGKSDGMILRTPAEK